MRDDRKNILFGQASWGRV